MYEDPDIQTGRVPLVMRQHPHLQVTHSASLYSIFAYILFQNSSCSDICILEKTASSTYKNKLNQQTIIFLYNPLTWSISEHDIMHSESGGSFCVIRNEFFSPDGKTHSLSLLSCWARKQFRLINSHTTPQCPKKLCSLFVHNLCACIWLLSVGMFFWHVNIMKIVLYIYSIYGFKNRVHKRRHSFQFKQILDHI